MPHSRVLVARAMLPGLRAVLRGKPGNAGNAVSRPCFFEPFAGSRRLTTRRGVTARQGSPSMGRKMIILRGNSAPEGNYPDEQGNTIAWPNGALHVDAATTYAKRRGYEPNVLNVPGQPQSRTS